MTFGQACGIYRINYIGEVKTEETDIKKIKLPTTRFLHNLEMENSELAFIEINFDDEKFEVKTKSHLTSQLYSNAEKLKEFLQSKNESIPIIFVLEKNGIITEMRTEIYWRNTSMEIIDDDGFGTLFQFNFGEIVLN